MKLDFFNKNEKSSKHKKSKYAENPIDFSFLNKKVKIFSKF